MIELYYNQLFERNDGLINPVPPGIFKMIYENTDNNINKFIYLSQNLDVYNLDYFISGVKKLQKEFNEDLILLAKEEFISVDSPLFKADCLLKVKERDAIPYLNQNHLKMLNEDTILAFLSKGALIDDECWNPVLNSFTPDLSFSNWQSQYISKNHKLKDGGPIFMELIETIKENYKGKDIIFDKDININNFLPKLFAVCAEKIEYINNNKDIYIEMEKIRKDGYFYYESTCIEEKKYN